MWWFSDSVGQWINESMVQRFMSQWVDESMNHHWFNDSVSHWVNEATNQKWMDEWMNEWMNEWVNEWLNEWMIEWMKEWLNERVIEWMDEWMNERMKEGRKEGKKEWRKVGGKGEWSNESLNRWINESSRYGLMKFLRAPSCKSAPSMLVFWAFWHANRALPTFWCIFCRPHLPKVLRAHHSVWPFSGANRALATVLYAFWRLYLPRVLRARHFLTFSNCKSSSRYSPVHFLSIALNRWSPEPAETETLRHFTRKNNKKTQGFHPWIHAFPNCPLFSTAPTRELLLLTLLLTWWHDCPWTFVRNSEVFELNFLLHNHPMVNSGYFWSIMVNRGLYLVIQSSNHMTYLPGSLGRQVMNRSNTFHISPTWAIYSNLDGILRERVATPSPFPV